jgi:hypothetical protein
MLTTGIEKAFFPKKSSASKPAPIADRDPPEQVPVEKLFVDPAVGSPDADRHGANSIWLLRESNDGLQRNS